MFKTPFSRAQLAQLIKETSFYPRRMASIPYSYSSYSTKCLCIFYNSPDHIYSQVFIKSRMNIWHAHLFISMGAVFFW